MSKLTTLFVIALFSMTFSKRVALGGDCDLFNSCEKGLSCVDYRCQIYMEGKNSTEVKWTPNGSKCDWFHRCDNGKQCVEHRCIETQQKQKQTQKQSTKLK